MIEINAVSKIFKDTTAVNNISFEVAEGENLILLGTSGCGKTTTLKMINRLIIPDSGEILINGKNIMDEKPELLRRKIGYVLQNTGLFPHYTVAENIAVIPHLLKWDKAKIKSRTKEIIEKLHLPDQYLPMFPSELSGGQQQRVGLARALITDSSILLMDEPFGALDNVTRLNIRKEFKALPELKRKTIMMVTHDVQEAFDLGDRICLMDKGEIIQIASPKELLYNPVNDFARKFLESERLSLQFKVLSLDDIWPMLSELKEGNFSIVSSTQNIWDTMDKLRNGTMNKLIIKSSSGAQKAIDFNSLTTAFNLYQEKYYHE